MALRSKVVAMCFWACLLVTTVMAVWPAFPSGIGSAPLGASAGSYPGPHSAGISANAAAAAPASNSMESSSSNRSSRSNGHRQSFSEVMSGGSCTCLRELQLIESRTKDYTGRLEELQGQVSNMQGAVSTLKTALNAVQGGGSGKRIAPQAFNIAFSARVGYNRPYLGETEVIVFDELVINNGDVYDPYSGKFTSPVPGLYQFQTTILSGFNSTIETMIVHNANEVARIFSGGFNTRGSGSNTVLLNMVQGDQVWVSVFYGNGDYVHGQWSTFNGHLVYAYTV